LDNSTIPTPKNLFLDPSTYDTALYRHRRKVENLFAKLKE
jgi:hypothetical protein